MTSLFDYLFYRTVYLYRRRPYLNNRAPTTIKTRTELSESIVNQWRGNWNVGPVQQRRRAGGRPSWVRVRGAGGRGGGRRSLPVQHSAAARRPHRSRPGELGELPAPPPRAHRAPHDASERPRADRYPPSAVPRAGAVTRARLRNEFRSYWQVMCWVAWHFSISVLRKKCKYIIFKARFDNFKMSTCELYVTC